MASYQATYPQYARSPADSPSGELPGSRLPPATADDNVSMPRAATYDPIDPTVRRILTWGIPVSLVAAGALSVQGLYELAVHVGWPRAVAWLLPVAVEVYAALSALCLFGTDTRYREGRKRAALNAVIAVGLSVALNEAWHLIRAGVLPMDWRVVVAVSAVPPAVVAALIHLALSLPAEVLVTAGTDEPSPIPKSPMVTQRAKVTLEREVPLPAEVPSCDGSARSAPRPDPVPSPLPNQSSGPAPVAAVGETGSVPGDVPGAPVPDAPVPLTAPDPTRRTVPDSSAVVDAKQGPKAVRSTNRSLPWSPPAHSVALLKKTLAEYPPGAEVTSKMLAERLGKTEGWWRRVRRWVVVEAQVEA